MSLLSRLKENKRVIIELMALALIGIVAGVALLKSDIIPQLFPYPREYENGKLLDLALVSLFVAMFCFAVFAFRRWQDVNRLLYEANTDSLTGLFNRRKGWEVIDLEIRRARRYKRPMSIILLDLDHFKNINDVHGHLVGDQVLNMVSKLVLKQLRSSDVLIRWGGEEFLIVCAETRHAGAVHLAERLRKVLEETEFHKAGHLTASFGVTELERDEDFNALFARVDDHLYTAKSNGRNTVV